MAQMTLSSLNYGAPAPSKSTGLGRGFYTPQQAKVERSAQYQNLDAMASGNVNKPTPKTPQVLEQASNVRDPNEDLFGSSSALNNYNTWLQTDVGSPSAAKNINRPIAGKALSEPYYNSKTTSNSSFNFGDFSDMLGKIYNEQSLFKQVSDPNFKALSEEEISKESDKIYKQKLGNTTWQDFLKPEKDAATVERNRQESFKFFKGDPTKIARSAALTSKYGTQEYKNMDAKQLFTNVEETAPSSYRDRLRELTAAKQYLGTEEGKKRAEAGKKLLDFYGSNLDGANSFAFGSDIYDGSYDYDDRNKNFMFSKAYLDRKESGLGLNPVGMNWDKVGLTPYMKAYKDELTKQQGLAGKTLTFSDNQKIRDKITKDFNQSVGFTGTGKFVPYEFTDANVNAKVAYLKDYPRTQKGLSDADLRKQAIRAAGLKKITNYEERKKLFGNKKYESLFYV